MSHFYGTLYGSGGPGNGLPMVECGGTRDSGLDVILRSNEGSVTVRLFEGEAPDGGLEDRVQIHFKKIMSWPPEVPPQFVGQEFELYSGPLSECCFSCIRTNTHESEVTS